MKQNTAIAVISLASCLSFVSPTRSEVQPPKNSERTFSPTTGETLELAIGGQWIQAERRGDVVGISTYDARNKHHEHLLGCRTGETTCSIRTTESDGSTQVHFLQEDAVAVRELVYQIDVGQTSLIGGSVVVPRDPERSRRRSGQRSTPDHVPTEVIVDQVLLRCPEGDTQMIAPKTDSEAKYYCPRHSHRLEVAGGSGHTQPH